MQGRDISKNIYTAERERVGEREGGGKRGRWWYR
jgi:hypothetical protein